MSKLLYFGNLPFTTTAADLTKLVKPHAEVISARIGLDRKTYKSRGFGFVEVPDAAVQVVIAALHGSKFQGRELQVNESTPHLTRREKEQSDREHGKRQQAIDDEIFPD
jgi:RNA recognition motif-containing protein